MTTPDAEDASPSPEYRSDLDDEMAAEQTSDRQNGHGSPTQKPTNGKPNAKDPLRPRRKKARRACFACQRAHLTCGDERPCNRCIKRGLQDHCMDGVRKKAKYLHDAPDGALMPGVGGHYPYMNGNRPTPIPSQDTQPVAVSPQSNMYTQAQTGAFYPPNSIQGQLPVAQDTRAFNNQQSPISPPFNQPHHGSVQNAPSTMSQGQQGQMHQQFGPLFDPSDPALFNFDISSLNFGNHYGALEFGMLGHMSSGAVETPHDNGMMNTMNGPVNMYNQPLPSGYADQNNTAAAMSFGPNGLPSGEWQESHSRQGSMHVHTPNNASVGPNHEHNGHRSDSINGPHAFAIGQGPATHSTASPASTDASTFEGDNPLATATFFANPNRPHAQRSPLVNRSQQENRPPNNGLQSIHANGIRKRQRDTKSVYQGITKPYDYVKGYHRLYQLIDKKYSRPWVAKAQQYLQNYRPVLLQVREELNRDDLIHQEMGLQRHLMTLQEHFAEVGTPFLICRRSGEIVGINKEFTILTGWKREVLLGHEPNQNVNTGANRDASETETSTQNTTPNLSAQDSETATPSVNIIELMDARSALEFLQHFSELCYQDPRGYASQRVNMLRYQTKADIDRLQDMKSANTGHDAKSDPLVKMEGGAVHQGESAMQRLGAKNGMVDCMIWWHIKRDIFDMPVLVCMSVMPVLDKGLQ
ncbi:transcription activator of gluconeogenesis [Stemphylium lycopersici]|uniref:Transcription activator of gluconeogenesis n=1 Tax=Stemphylium lycopersici TaxID=183478 RepID=A0A364MTF5_STELY|nr:transcription activator of gluconeogenesis [Stemphylium lycopersici]